MCGGNTRGDSRSGGN
ncbi:MAG: hypothetical protein ACLSS9_04480 [Acutalibacteraceae bacterium]